jgi:hypothetical protein
MKDRFMHKDQETKTPSSASSDTKSLSPRHIGAVIFFTLFGLWLLITLVGLMSSGPKTLNPDQAQAPYTAPAMDLEGNNRLVRPGDEGHVAVAPVRETDASMPIPATAAKTQTSPSTPHAGISGSGGHPNVVGWTFVEAAQKPMRYELYDRFWGWRPNDLIRPTDNVNNFQLGTLEVTRRTAVKLAEDISRTGSTASFDPNLENAMNWFMIRPTKFWFPSAESKYKAGLKELSLYQEKLVEGRANFYNRSDNLIPLLIAYKNLLGSCNDNLIKTHESNGSPVSFFKADDYFYYSKGVTSAMGTVLEAIEHDFYPMLQSRGGLETLRRAIQSCKYANDIDPIVILNSDLSGIFANHRANLATHVSLARFYIGVLITTLST